MRILFINILRAAAILSLISVAGVGLFRMDWSTIPIIYLGYQIFANFTNVIGALNLLAHTDRSESEAELADRVTKQTKRPLKSIHFPLNPNFDLKKVQAAIEPKIALIDKGYFNVFLEPLSVSLFTLFVTRGWRSAEYGYVYKLNNVRRWIEDLTAVLAIVLVVVGQPTGFVFGQWTILRGLNLPYSWLYFLGGTTALLTLTFVYNRITKRSVRTWDGYTDAVITAIGSPPWEDCVYGWIIPAGVTLILSLVGIPLIKAVAIGIVVSLPLFAIAHWIEKTNLIPFYIVSRAILTVMIVVLGFPMAVLAHIINNTVQTVLSWRKRKR